MNIYVDMNQALDDWNKKESKKCRENVRKMSKNGQ
jgi:hypothetical protein